MKKSGEREKVLKFKKFLTHLLIMFYENTNDNNNSTCQELSKHIHSRFMNVEKSSLGVGLTS